MLVPTYTFSLTRDHCCRLVYVRSCSRSPSLERAMTAVTVPTCLTTVAAPYDKHYTSEHYLGRHQSSSDREGVSRPFMPQTQVRNGQKIPDCPPLSTQRGQNGQVHLKSLPRFAGSGGGDGGAAACYRGRRCRLQGATLGRRWSIGRRCPHHPSRLGADFGHAHENHRSTDEQRQSESSQDRREYVSCANTVVESRGYTQH